MDDDPAVDLRTPSPASTFVRWLGLGGPPRGYALTRWLILRLLGVVYVFAFLGIVLQGPALLGSHGLTPVASFVDYLHAHGLGAWDVPSLFMLDSSDAALTAWAWVGLALAACVAIGYANLPILVGLWLIYGSYERVGQLWWGFGWEIQILETTLIAAMLAHPWDPRPLRARAPPTTAIVLARWLVFRIMLGAGLIKLRGDPCWRDLTCLDWHFESQPIPNPASPWFHYASHAFHAFGVVFNHVVEVVCPWFVFGPRRLRIIAGILMLAFQFVLIASGNLAFLNWLTIVPILACFDDDALLAVMPRRLRDRLRAKLPAPAARSGWQLAAAIVVGFAAVLVLANRNAAGVFIALLALAPVIAFAANADWRRWIAPKLGKRDLQQILVGVFAGLVIYKSAPVVDNLTSHHQAMNRAYDRLELVNTYGAFGSVDEIRHELVIEGTMAANPQAPDAEWRAYELPCKPGDTARRPCVLGPYHRRLDWLIWFSAMHEQPSVDDAWLIHVLWKLLDGDRTVRTLLAVDPFDGAPPKWVRVRRFVYRFARGDEPGWWVRSDEQLWIPPVAKDTPNFADELARFGWPSPSEH